MSMAGKQPVTMNSELTAFSERCKTHEYYLPSEREYVRVQDFAYPSQIMDIMLRCDEKIYHIFGIPVQHVNERVNRNLWVTPIYCGSKPESCTAVVKSTVGIHNDSRCMEAPPLGEGILSDVGSQALLEGRDSAATQNWFAELSPYESDQDLQLQLLATDMRNLLNDDDLSDVCFSLDDGSQISANRAILACRSEVFKAMLFGEMKEGAERVVTISGVSRVTFEAVLAWCYTGSISSVLPQLPRPSTTADERDRRKLRALFAAVDPNRLAEVDLLLQRHNTEALRAEMWSELGTNGSNLFDVVEEETEALPKDSSSSLCSALGETLAAADMYQLGPLKDLCARRMVMDMDAYSVCDVLQLAEQHSHMALKQAALEYLNMHKLEVAQTGHLDLLSKELLLEAFLLTGR